MKCNSRVIVLLIGLAAAVVAIGLDAYHTKPHCSLKTPAETSSDCSMYDMEKQCPGTYAVSQSYGGVSQSIKCPWRKATYILGFASVAVTIILLVLLGVAVCGNPLKAVMVIVGIVGIPLLLVACGLMLKDLVDGFKFLADHPGTYSVPVGTYVANVVLLVILAIISAWAMCAVFKITKEAAASQRNVVKVNSGAQPHQQLANHSQSVSRGNWQDTSSMNVSNTYGNQYTHGNLQTYGNQQTYGNSNSQRNNSPYRSNQRAY